MQLDPQVVALLDRFARVKGKPFAEMTPAEARLAGRNIMALSIRAESVARVAYRFAPGPTADLPIWLYFPDGPGPWPAIVFLHGGGFVMNTVEAFDPLVRALVNRSGCVFAAVNYQKAPEHKFPIPLDDCYAALQWVSEQAEELGIDRDRIGVAGDSSGGNLAAAVCLRARDEHGPPIACQVLICPVLDYGWDRPSTLAFGDGYLLQREAIMWFWTQYLSSPRDGENPLASPVRAPNLAGLPPAVVVTAEYDPLLDETEAYIARLRQAEVPVRVLRYDGMIHGFHVMGGLLDRARELYRELGEAISVALS